MGSSDDGACNKTCRKASIFTDDDDDGEDDKAEPSRRSKICQDDTPSSGGGGEEDYMYDDYDGSGSGEEEEDYMYEDDGGSDGEEESEQALVDDAIAAACAPEQRYVVLTEADLRARQDADTAKVAEVLSVPAGLAAVLVRHFNWRAGRVEEEWFTDDRRVRAAVGLPILDDLDGGDDLLVVPADPARVICWICFDEHPASATASASCASHRYCAACWRGYVSAAVRDGPRCLSLRCPDPSCPAPVARELVDEVLDDEGGERYARFWLRSYVEESGGRLRWCGGAGCGRALELLVGVAGGNNADVVCACGHGVCWSCGEEAHRPVSCGTVRAWLAKNASDSETANWVLAHTKHCPKCRRPIEKNQGCNHMTCGAPCGHHFCWLCLQPAGGRNHYACSDPHPRRLGAQPFDDDVASTATTATTGAVVEQAAKRRAARAALQRYLHHYERWAANGAALESARRDVAALERGELERMAAMVAGDVHVPATELAFVGEAYRQVGEGRRVLRWAHAYGYFLFLDPGRDAARRALFDDLQNQANRWLECLHASVELERKDMFGASGGEGKGKGKGKEAAAATEEPAAGGVATVDAEAFRAYRQKVANLTRVTRKFLGNLVSAFETDLPEVVAAVSQTQSGQVAR